MTATQEALGLARSFLFVPATRPERFAKALASGADAVIIDLEDAVAPADKDQARARLAAAWPEFSEAQRQRLLLRINAAGTAWHEPDLALARALAPAALMVSKAESVSGLAAVANAAGADCALVPLIESLAGLDALDMLVRAPQVIRMAFGHLDFQLDVGMAAGPEEHELSPVRLAMVLSSRRAGLPTPVDGVTVATDDDERLRRDTARAKRLGFGGKLCIHPAQVEHVNAGFSPDAAELAWAERVVAALQAAGGGVVTLDGRMVDAPVLSLAQRTIAKKRNTAHR